MLSLVVAITLPYLVAQPTEIFQFTDSRNDTKYHQLGYYAIAGDFLVSIESNIDSEYRDPAKYSLRVQNLETKQTLWQTENSHGFGRPVISSNGQYMLVQSDQQKATFYSGGPTRFESIKTYDIPPVGSGGACYFYYALAIDNSGKYLLDTYGSDMVALYSMPEYEIIGVKTIRANATMFDGKAAFFGDSLTVSIAGQESMKEAPTLTSKTLICKIADFKSLIPDLATCSLEIGSGNFSSAGNASGSIMAAENTEDAFVIHRDSNKLPIVLPRPKNKYFELVYCTEKYFAIRSNENGMYTTSIFRLN